MSRLESNWENGISEGLYFALIFISSIIAWFFISQLTNNIKSLFPLARMTGLVYALPLVAAFLRWRRLGFSEFWPLLCAALAYGFLLLYVYVQGPFLKISLLVVFVFTFVNIFLKADDEILPLYVFILKLLFGFFIVYLMISALRI